MAGDAPSYSGRVGAIVPPDGAGGIDAMAHAVLDDLLYNIIHDICQQAHREEKISRATTAAIRVEKLASDSTDSSDPDPRPDVRVETDAAIYDDGKVMLKGNPLKTTKEILCPRCHLPRLLAPTDGRGAQKADPSIIYCKKHPYIDKPGYDIYGQTWIAPGPGRGKKKKDVEQKDGAPPTTTADGQRPAGVLAFPSATCSKCKRCILVTRLNNHMGSCIGNSGRNASRVASQKISGGNDPTPPPSQKGTPLPGSRAGSPRKRERDGDDYDDEEDEDSDVSAAKRRRKKVGTAQSNTPVLPPKKVTIKTKGMRPEKVKQNSFLRAEQKFEDVVEDGLEVIPAKKLLGKISSPAKKLKLGLAKAPMSSPASTKHGTDADAESEVSEAYSSPPR